MRMPCRLAASLVFLLPILVAPAAASQELWIAQDGTLYVDEAQAAAALLRQARLTKAPAAACPLSCDLTCSACRDECNTWCTEFTDFETCNQGCAGLPANQQQACYNQCSAALVPFTAAYNECVDENCDFQVQPSDRAREQEVWIAQDGQLYTDFAEARAALLRQAVLQVKAQPSCPLDCNLTCAACRISCNAWCTAFQQNQRCIVDRNCAGLPKAEQQACYNGCAEDFLVGPTQTYNDCVERNCNFTQIQFDVLP